MEDNTQLYSNIDSDENTRLVLRNTRLTHYGRLGLIFLTILGGVAAIFLLLSTISFQAAVAHTQPSAIITVDTLSDEEIVNGSCSLREAITAANINYAVDKCPAGNTITDTITFAVQGTITLTNQLPNILNAGSLVIDGGENIVISGNDKHRAFWVNPGANLALVDLKVVRSRWPVDSTSGGGGYGLYNNGGDVGIYGCEFSSNNSFAEPGGTIYNTGTMTIEQSRFENNLSHFSQGGAIANLSKMIILDSIFLNNWAAEEGGAIWNDANLSKMIILDSIFLNNWADEGGAIRNDGLLNIYSSTFDHNWSYERGGAIGNSGIMSVTNSSFSDNIVGGYTSDCQVGGEMIGNSGWAQINHNTIIDKSAEGGVIVCNQEDSTLIIQNSIVASDPAYTNCLGTITDGGYNIDSQDTCGFDPANGSLVNTDPSLGELQNNGGPTWTFAPQAGSPAIDAASPVDCPSSDQRGVPRPLDGDGDSEARCDIGAYEVAPPGIPRPTQTSITSVSPEPSLVNKPVIIGFQVTSAFGVPSGTVTVTVADHAESCVGSLNNGSGSCSFMLAEPGIYTLTATYGGEGDYLTSADIQAHQILTTIAFLPLVPKEHPLAVQVIGVSFVSGDRGISYYMQGMLNNISMRPVYSVTVTAYLFDEEGFFEGVYTTTTPLPVIFPGQNMPFRPVNLGFYQQPPDSYRIIPSYSYHSSREYRPVTVLSQEISNPSYDYVSISGEIRNNQDVELRSIKVIVMPGGPYTMYAFASLGADTLLPGETTPYTLTERCSYYPMYDPCPTDFSVQGQGYLNP